MPAAGHLHLIRHCRTILWLEMNFKHGPGAMVRKQLATVNLETLFILGELHLSLYRKQQYERKDS